ncbi:hypothetical protein GCM10007973_11990 [Polymorphobacter multimanifer]|uniref:MerC domain-containing protein n=1 Tax=Polymorphobacter multimanifer TaxID=1070431 RepID=A0A841L5P8_9SPHN|nr:MerC domain-containing protein [Polymorphobacter multimanifer]MBB6227750.1 hypothetical protein [Polymorphobacter multimanifer]GGI76731.1 hypothetical protein GCM10007973_11990 [Polymorphobacter multimanifer]
MKTGKNSNLDRAAILLSGLCLVHCLAGALLVAGLTLAGGWMSHDVHAIGLALALPLAAVALWRGFRLHGRVAVLLLGAAGIGLMAASVFMEHAEHAELTLSVAGVIVLALAHLWNMQAVRR